MMDLRFLLIFSSLTVVINASTGAAGFSKVTFAEPISNVTVAVGRDAALSCVVDNLGSHRVAWVHLDRQMILTIHRQVVTRVGRFSVSYDHQRTWHLHIRGVQTEDAGRYMCQVNSEPMISQVGHVHVVVPPSIDDSDSSPSQLSVREGVRVSLVCRARGVPASRVSWKREDGKSYIETDSPSSGLVPSNKRGQPADSNNNNTGASGIKAIIAQDGEELILPKVSRTDSAHYLCIASNGVPPSVSKRITLDVEFEPLMFVPNQLLGAPVGGSVTLECQTEAHPRPITYWIRTDANNVNGVMLLPSKRYKLVSHHTGYQTSMSLHIHRVEMVDIGNYKCVSKNSLGEAEGSIRIYEMMAPPPTPKAIDTYRPTPASTTTTTSTALLMIPADDESAAEGSDELLEDAEDELTFRRPHEKIYGDQQNDFANVRSSASYIIQWTTMTTIVLLALHLI